MTSFPQALSMSTPVERKVDPITLAANVSYYVWREHYPLAQRHNDQAAVFAAVAPELFRFLSKFGTDVRFRAHDLLALWIVLDRFYRGVKKELLKKKASADDSKLLRYYYSTDVKMIMIHSLYASQAFAYDAPLISATWTRCTGQPMVKFIEDVFTFADVMHWNVSMFREDFERANFLLCGSIEAQARAQFSRLDLKRILANPPQYTSYPVPRHPLVRQEPEVAQAAMLQEPAPRRRSTIDEGRRALARRFSMLTSLRSGTSVLTDTTPALVQPAQRYPGNHRSGVITPPRPSLLHATLPAPTTTTTAASSTASTTPAAMLH